MRYVLLAVLMAVLAACVVAETPAYPVDTPSPIPVAIPSAPPIATPPPIPPEAPFLEKAEAVWTGTARLTPGIDSELILYKTPFYGITADIHTGGYGAYALVIQTGDDILEEELDGGYGAIVYAADIDGCGLDELVIRIGYGGSGARSGNTVRKLIGGQLVTVFDFDGFDAGWTLEPADDWVFTIGNANTGYSRVFRNTHAERHSFWAASGYTNPSDDTVTCFYPVKTDGVFAIFVESFITVWHHHNQLGLAQAVLRWDGEAMRVTDTTFWPSGDTYGEGPADALRDALAANQGASPQAVEAFFRYYVFNQQELRFLPLFTADRVPDWNDLTLFVYYHAEVNRNEDGYSFMTVDEFERVMNMFFPAMSYTHRSSGLLDFDEESGYTPAGFSYHGGTRFRLVSLSETHDVWTAVLDRFDFSEDDFVAPQPDGYQWWYTDNLLAMMEFNGGRHPDRAFDDVLLAMFLRDDYDELLQPSSRVAITFTLQDDPMRPLQYVSHGIVR